MENIGDALCIIFIVFLSYFMGFCTYKNLYGFYKNMKELEEKNKCEDDKCCGCKYCNKNK